MATQRFHTLDAMRGVAAIAVVVLHLTLQLGVKPQPLSYMAVDFFFMLSGFVLATVYEKRLITGLSPRDFLIARFVRLYPMYFLGMVFGAVTLVVQHLAHSGHSMSATGTAMAIVTGFLMIPDPATLLLFPANSPAWSLFLELVINIAFATVLVRLSTRALAILVCGFGAAYIAATIYNGQMTYGLSWPSLGGGLVRVTFPFAVGVLFSRLRTNASTRPVGSVVLVLALLIAILVPVGSVQTVPYNIIITVAVMPVLLWFGIRWQMSPAWTGLSDALGDLSYPLYAVHFPLMQMASFAAKAGHISPMLFSIVFLVVSCGLSLILARTVDPAARTALAGLIGRAKRLPKLANA